jgi:hypothetical protein
MTPKTKQIAVTVEDEIDADSVPYRRLWLWVVGQAVLEADGHGMNGIEMKYHPRYTGPAIEWLTTESNDLREACELAGLSYRAVLERSRKKFLKGGK